MIVVGLTGGIGSGKTTVLHMFKELGIACYIADVEARKLINKSKIIRRKISREFGDNAYNTEGLNRKFIASIVFKNPEKLQLLNSIVHPKVHKHLQKFIQKAQGDYIIYENAILFENKSDALCDYIITVTAPKEVKVKRVLLRDSTTKDEVLNRMNNQISDKEKGLKSTYIINNIDLEETKKAVLKIHKDLCAKITAKTKK